MTKKSAILLVLVMALVSTVLAAEDDHDITRLDHVFLIIMENHGFSQIINNPNAPFTNKLARSANLATNYFAVAHPSLTNYLEIVGGSNFGVLSDNASNWHNKGCTVNIVHNVANTDTPPSPNVCPITGSGTD